MLIRFTVASLLVIVNYIDAGMPGIPLQLTRVPPCAKGQTVNCDANRIKNCGTITSGYSRIFAANTDCGNVAGHIDPYVTENVLVRFSGADGCKEILMQPGECWGQHPIQTANNYDCQGRCGASCAGSSCSNWAADCLRHDVCSWYYGATGGATDANCGDEYNDAVGDTTNICLWVGVNACESKYDSVAASTKAWICPA